MSIDEQIEAAWEKYVNDMDEGVRNTVAFHSDVFAEGYRAALRGLWRDSDFDECQDFDWYWVLTDRGWNHVMKNGEFCEVITDSGDTTFTCEREDIKRIVYTNLTSPAEVFGEEVGDK